MDELVFNIKYLILNTNYTKIIYTLSDRIGKVVASHAAGASSVPAEAALIYNMHWHSGGTAHYGGGCDQ